MVNSNRFDPTPRRPGRYLRRGEPLVWATGMALALVLLLTLTLVVVILVNGLGVFWPSKVVLVTLVDGGTLLGEIHQRETIHNGEDTRVQLKIGNRDLYRLDFRWVDDEVIVAMEYPEHAVVLERQEHGNFYGFFEQVTTPEGSSADWEMLRDMLASLESSRRTLHSLDRETINLGINLSRVTKGNPQKPAETMTSRELAIKTALDEVQAQRREMLADLDAFFAEFVAETGESKVIPLLEIVRAYKPNSMNTFEKCAFYLAKLKELFLDDPREANTEGGLFPAIFGTVILVFLMSIFSFPLGVIAGIYLREYAKEGLLLRSVRIAVNNLAGVPSIVYGIFGLGFFVYGIGSTIDQFFFADRLPTPTYGTGGILWASLTLGILTVPVVIVSTEEALGAIPRGIRESSMSLGATKFQTLWRVLIPMASPGIMTGFILAMARAAGEVAPLMITGVVKLAPTLPIDGQFPYFHPDRKFMHLGFHIYDVGFQSPNVEAAKPMVFVTTLLLVFIVMLMSSTAIILRNRMKRKYTVTSL